MTHVAQPVNRKYQRIRAALVSHGLSIPRWAALHGYPASTVYDAARGARVGSTSKKILKQLEAIVHE